MENTFEKLKKDLTLPYFIVKQKREIYNFSF